MWAVVSKATGQVIGNCGLKYLEAGRDVEVGYHFASSAWGKGYATEAARACVRYGFERLGLHRIVAVVLPTNMGSRRVLEKSGLTYQGMGHYYGKDLMCYAIDRLPAGVGEGRLRGRVSHTAPGNPSGMDSAKQPPGPLEPEKHGETADPGHPQPEAAEVESARLLANQARGELRQAGLTDEDITRLADDYVALDRGEDLADFIAWAKKRGRT
jgi:GNAT acetyltransferase-like protein